MYNLTHYEYGALLPLSLLYYLMMLPALYYLLVKQYKRIADTNIAVKGMNWFFCLPAGFYFALVMSLRVLFSAASAAKNNFLPSLLFIMFCEFAAYFAALGAITSGLDAAMEREKLCIAQTQLALWQSEHENLELQIQSDARARHDWRHHIITVLGYADGNDLAGLREYLDAYKEKYLAPEEASICDVAALNMLFQYYKHKASEQGVELTISTVSLVNSAVRIWDFTIVFGNLLENAIEACVRMEEGERHIALKICNKEDNLIAIICENSFDGAVNYREDRIVSRKQMGGIGLSSVEGIVTKYNGSMEIRIKEKKFKVYITLQ